ncbi:MAG: hypothetical protein M1418_05365, partial [Deltaproteobacteria bacterium]|nr:hypothetical protein [Deltaproteobacteria bacterium]
INDPCKQRGKISFQLPRQPVSSVRQETQVNVSSSVEGRKAWVRALLVSAARFAGDKEGVRTDRFLGLRRTVRHNKREGVGTRWIGLRRRSKRGNRH